MSSEFDPELRRLFVESRESLDEGPFAANVLIEIGRARRAQLRRRLTGAAVALAILALAMPWVAPVLAGAIEQAGRFSLATTTFLMTPAGWAVSMLLGGLVLARMRYSRR